MQRFTAKPRELPMRGRKPDPARLKLLNEETQRVIGGSVPPSRPSWLTGSAAEEWDRIITELSKTFLVTSLDATTLAAYCKAYAMWREYDLILERDGLMTVDSKGDVKPHPAANMCVKMFSELRRMASEFGFSPAARSRIDVPKGESQEDADFNAFQAGAEQVG